MSTKNVQALFSLVIWLAFTDAARASAVYAFTTIDYPGADLTSVLGINNSGQLVGDYTIGGVYYGFLYSGGTFTPIDVPGATATRPFGINSSGQIVGDTFIPGLGSRGFLFSGGTYTILGFPGGQPTETFGNNDADQIVGLYSDTTDHGYILSGGTYTGFDVPGSSQTAADDINDSGQVVGFTTIGGTTYGYLDNGGSFSLLAAGYSSIGINDAGQIVGHYYDAFGNANGFLLSDGVYSTVDFPGAFATRPVKINDAGDIVGDYTAADGTVNGFIAVPIPEPASAFLAGLGILALCGYRMRRPCE